MLRKSVFTVFALLGVAGVAAAEPITLPANSPLAFKFSNAEQINTNIAGCIDVPGSADYGCSDNWGILKISSLTYGVIDTPNDEISTGGPQLTPPFFDGAGGNQITGLFYGIDIDNCAGMAPAPPCTATGGVLDLYWQEGQNVGAPTTYSVATAAQADATVDTFTSGVFLARLLFAPGQVDGDASTTVTSSVNFQNLAADWTGFANGYMDVDTTTVGAWTDALNGNWFHVDTDGDGNQGEPGELRDVRFSNRFDDLVQWNGAPGVIGASSDDPATVMTAVPEPASLTLFGVGLSLAALAARRRSKKNVA